MGTMNERIKELFEQAHITTTRQVIKGGWDNDRPPYEYRTETTTVFNPEVFAQLIVRECASLAYDGPGGILEHFGIEQ